jgi:hypothetical protein
MSCAKQQGPLLTRASDFWCDLVVAGGSCGNRFCSILELSLLCPNFFVQVDDENGQHIELAWSKF